MPRLLTTWLIGLVMLVGSSAWAQGQGEKADKKKKLQKMAGQQKSLVEEDIDSMSGQGKLDRGEQKISESRKSLEATNAHLEKAREEEKDIQKINCINDKLAAIKGFLKVAEQSYVKLKEAVKKDDVKEANHHYTLISVAHQKVQEYLEEAKLCAGEVERYAEGTKVEMDRDRELPGDPEYLSEEPTAVETLPELTPFQ
ncbi:MAG: hypothetical protein ABEN55_08490 [Bradymonadaceae bacterium]